MKKFLKKYKLHLIGIAIAIALLVGAFLSERKIDVGKYELSNIGAIHLESNKISYAAPLNDNLQQKQAKAVPQWIVTVNFEQYPDTWFSKSFDLPFSFYTNYPEKLDKDLVAKILEVRGFNKTNLLKAQYLKSIMPAPKGWFQIANFKNLQDRYANKNLQ